jgi:crotonobetainyl-CoA:carnitine CoA-transferase CaiB-like acyl-CoA transferase
MALMVGAATSDRVGSAIAGTTLLTNLTVEERAIVNARLNATIAAAVAAADFGEELRREGITTVALNEVGQMVEYPSVRAIHDRVMTVPG